METVKIFSGSNLVSFVKYSFLNTKINKTNLENVIKCYKIIFDSKVLFIMTEKDYQIRKYRTDLTPLMTATLPSLLMTPMIILLTKPKTKSKRKIERKRQGRHLHVNKFPEAVQRLP